MGILKEGIIKYEIEICSDFKDGILAKIDCNRMDDSKSVFCINFLRDGMQLPKNEFHSPLNDVRAYFHFAQFLNILNVLREHKPTYLKFDTETNQVSLILSPV